MAITANEDGLTWAYGLDEAVPSGAGEFRNDGPYHVIELTIEDMTEVPADAAIQDNSTIFPKGARIERVDVVTETAVTSDGSAVLNIGLQRLDRSTELDYEAFVKALPIASFNAAGETVSLTAGATYAGDLIGTTTSNPGYLTADYTTSAFTAGKTLIRVFYRFPVNTTAI